MSGSFCRLSAPLRLFGGPLPLRLFVRPLSQAGADSGGDGGALTDGSKEAVERLVRAHPVVVFMKGSPARPQCGFSNAVVQILRLHGVNDYRAYDVLRDSNLRQDPFADATKGDDLLPAGTEDYIHIRIQQRNGRKTLTTVQGIADDYDKKKLVKAFKKVGIVKEEQLKVHGF
uniref:Eukaryotic translation initiation factor 1B n=1 Tax=Varanus komodoensis TaxID=61221 RepID=A0A8D2Q3E2_VARKO